MKKRKILGIMMVIIVVLVIVGVVMASLIYACIAKGLNPWIGVGLTFGCIAFIAVIDSVIWLAVNLIYPKD